MEGWVRTLLEVCAAAGVLSAGWQNGTRAKRSRTGLCEVVPM